MEKIRVGDQVVHKKSGRIVTVSAIDVSDFDGEDGLPYRTTDNDGNFFRWLSWTEVEKVGQSGAGDGSPGAHGHPRFLALCDEMKAVHQKKGSDYGSDRDIFENIRRSERIGIPASKGCWLRACDKVGRLDKFFSRKALVNESAIDSLLDLANYCVIAVCLLEEEAKGNQVGKD